MQTKHVPMRMCNGCGEMKSKKELVRVVKSKEGEISLDLTGKKAGRGAYICSNLECLQKQEKQGVWRRRFPQEYRMKFMTRWNSN